jgi:hypothetical protein
VHGVRGLPSARERRALCQDYGHIYMYRFRPVSYEMKAYSIHSYPARCQQGQWVWCSMV